MEDYIIKCDINNRSNFCVNGGVIYFIQLPRFEEERKLLDNDVKYEDIVKNKLDEWCVFLSNKSQEVRNMVAKNNINIEEAIKQYEELSSIPEVVETAFRRRIAEMDRMAREQDAMKTGMEKGLKKGMKVGKKEGRKEGKIEGKIEGIIESKKEIAKKLLNQKINMQVIINATGLTKEEIEAIV